MSNIWVDDFYQFNLKNKADAKSFVSSCLYKLIGIFNIDDEYTIDEAEDLLVDYFTKYPDQIPQITVKYLGGEFRNYVLKTNNIGGIYSKRY